MLTSVAQRGHKTLAREAGISACLTKPVRQSQLFDCVATVLGASVAPEVPRVPPVTLRLPRQTPLILVAEDNIVNQRVSVRLLEKLGYRADVAANGYEAVAALERIPYASGVYGCAHAGYGRLRRHGRDSSAKVAPGMCRLSP